MKSKISKLLVAGSLVLATGWLSMSFVNYQDAKKKPWDVPEAAKSVKNPVASSAESIAKGKELYTKSCKSCHGVAGKGDGPKSSELETPCGDFTAADFQKQTDGAIFHKAKEGRNDMPSFKTKLPVDADIWAIVTYIRTLK